MSDDTQNAEHGAHQQETVKLDGFPITLYKRTDLFKSAWHMRIKLEGENRRYIRASTKLFDFDAARTHAIRAYVEVGIKQDNDIPLFSKTFRQLADECIADWELKLKMGAVSNGTVRMHSQ